MFFPGDAPYDLRKTAVVEADEKPPLPSSPPPPESSESCRVVVAGLQRLVVDAQLQQPGLLVVSDLFYPGWTAEVVSAAGTRTQVPILRTNRIMRGVVLPVGTHRIAFVYRPLSFYAGALISVAAWLIFGEAFFFAGFFGSGFGCMNRFQFTGTSFG